MGAWKRPAIPVSRRVFARILGGAALARICGATPDAAPRLAWDADRAADLSLERHYRAEAQVLLLGLTVLRRQNVGGGSVIWRESGGGATRLLEFNGFSLPERAAGLNRVGFMREMARTPLPGPGECIYFGLMTASPEESAEEARKSLHTAAREQAYTAIDGHIAGGLTETAIAHFSAPAAISGAHAVELLDMARQALASASKRAESHPQGEYSPSFLQAMAGLLLRRDAEECRYHYSGRRYRMRLARSEDAKATAYFRRRGLLAGSAVAIRVSGRVQREAGGKETEFRLWVPDSGQRPLPLRIEYRAKSYLRLTFEAAS